MRSINLVGALLIFASPAALYAAKTKPAAQSAQAVAAPAAPQFQVPAAESLVIMIRYSLTALSQANTTNNYSVLNSLGTDNFRTTNPPVRLAELFSAFRANKIDLAPINYVNPVLSQTPSINGNTLRLVGYFPTQPMQVNFDLQYEGGANGWTLNGIGVNLNVVPQVADAKR